MAFGRCRRDRQARIHRYAGGVGACFGPDRLRAAQEAFELTGGLHASALFDLEGRLLVLREDVGRHNALDKVLGHALMHGLLPLDRHRDLIIADTVKIPFVVFGDMLDDIYGV